MIYNKIEDILDKSAFIIQEWY